MDLTTTPIASISEDTPSRPLVKPCRKWNGMLSEFHAEQIDIVFNMPSGMILYGFECDFLVDESCSSAKFRRSTTADMYQSHQT